MMLGKAIKTSRERHTQGQMSVSKLLELCFLFRSRGSRLERADFGAGLVQAMVSVEKYYLRANTKGLQHRSPTRQPRG